VEGSVDKLGAANGFRRWKALQSQSFFALTPVSGAAVPVENLGASHTGLRCGVRS